MYSQIACGFLQMFPARLGGKSPTADEIPKIWKVIKFHGSKPPISYKSLIIPFSMVYIPCILHKTIHYHPIKSKYYWLYTKPPSIIG
jgi:hypothetical protein